MKAHTSEFKNQIKTMGRELDSKITYTLNGVNIELGKEQLNSITPTYQGALLKSVMKELDIDSNVYIPEKTILNYQFGVKVNGEYEYINYGNYVVYKTEKQEDTNSYKLTCYDKMLYSMVDYEKMDITYPISIRDYIKAICDKLGLTFKNANSTFANYDKQIQNELYLDSENNSLGYTFRDVLDELSQVTASCICINGNDELEIRYIGENINTSYVSSDNNVMIIDNSIKSNAISYKVYGNSIQEKRSGKNLFNSFLYSNGTKNGITLTKNDDGTITLNGTSTAQTDFNVIDLFSILADSNTTASIRKISGSYVNNGSNSLSVEWNISDGSWGNRIYTNLDGINYDISTGAKMKDGITYKKCTLRIQKGITCTNLVLGLQIEKGNITFFEQYGVSPSPDYPSEIISIPSVYNLFDGELELGTIVSGSGKLISSTKSIRSKNYIKVKPNTTYILSNDKNYTPYVFEYNEDKEYISNSTEKVTPYTFTTGENTRYIKFRTIEGKTENDLRTLFQLEKGTIAHDYVPYGLWLKINITNDTQEQKVLVDMNKYDSYRNIVGYHELSSIEDTKDILDLISGKFSKKIGKYMFTGEESFEKAGEAGTGYYGYYITLDDYGVNISGTNNPKVLCTHFLQFDYGWNKTQLGFMIGYNSSNNKHIIIFIVDNITTEEDFKTWLSENQVTIYYELAEQETIQITPTNIQLFEGINNITLLEDLETYTSIEYQTKYDTIDEEFLKDININFGEKYGAINTIVLSRSGGSDNIYFPETLPENPFEFKISDNQIMNFNDRADYLPDIYSKLNGLEFYLNDFSSTGICYYELLDRYNVKIGDNTYSCIMFNDEVNITQGLEEKIYTEIPEETETDYTKADKTDRKINQTYLIVDKQKQIIESVITQTTEQNQKIAKITQTVDELNSKISDVADITTSAEDINAKIELNEINQSEPIRLVVRPIGENISYLYPNDNLYPSDDLFMKTRTIRFHNKTTNKDFDYELPDDLLYYDSENYDEFILDYDGQSCVINKKVGYNEDGTTYVLDTPKAVKYEFPANDKAIILTEGDYVVKILGYETGYIFARLMAKNIYTTQFYTKAETNSIISQTSQNITLSVDKKLSKYSTTTEMNAAITLKAEEINQQVSEKVGDDEVVAKLNLAIRDKQGIINIFGNQVIIDSDNFKLTKEGNIECSNAKITGGQLNISQNESETRTPIILNQIYKGNTYRGQMGGSGTSYYRNNVTGVILNVSPTDGKGKLALWNTENTNEYNYVTPTGIRTTSDIRYKDNIKNINQEESINIINNITPIEFTYKNSKNYHRGLSAQELKETLEKNQIYNEIVNEDFNEITKEDVLSINYTELIPDLINYCKYLNKKIIDLENKIKEKENK